MFNKYAVNEVSWVFAIEKFSVIKLRIPAADISTIYINDCLSFNPSVNLVTACSSAKTASHNVSKCKAYTVLEGLSR